MALPKISTPEFFDVIPSTNQEIQYRPFLVGEEKTLLIALEGQDNKEISNAILRLLKSCIMSDVNIDKLSTFDIEYLFLKVRGKSVGEIINASVGHTSEDSECKHKTEIQINIDDIKVQGDIKDGKIMITDDVGVKMRYPTLGTVMKMKGEDAESLFNMILDCIEYIYDKEQIYNEGDFTREELSEWVNNLNQAQFKNISTFFEEMPKLKHTITWKCPKCGEDEEMVVEGLQSFFTLR